MPEKFPVTQDTARVALQYIDAHDRTLWVKIGQALKSEFGDEGLHLFDEWSATATNYDSKAVKSTWKGFKSSGRVTIGTLIHEAKARGFDPKAQASNATPSELTAEARAQAVAKRKEAEQREAKATAQAHQNACNEAVALLAKAVDKATSPYLGIKKVGAYGVRFDVSPNDGGVDVLVPMCDAQGKLWGVQRIKPDGSKLFIKGGRKSGLWHLIGEVSDASHIEGVGVEGAQSANHWLLVAEGYATASTLHEATGYPVAVAFDAGNLAPVCDALRALYPSVRLLVCADNDQATEQRTGKNTGVESARVASERVGGAVAIPDGLPLDKSDFNDLALLQGLDAVKAQIEGAIKDASTAHTNANDKANTAPPTPKNEPHNATPQATDTDGAEVGKKAGRGANGRFISNGGAWFECNDNGVFYHGFTNEGKEKPPLMICTPLRVTANTRDESENDWGYLLEFADPLGNPKTWAMPSRMLSGDGASYRERLLSMGLRIEAGNEARNLLSRYIQTSHVDTFARCTERVGWFDGVFVLPDCVIGDTQDERVLFQSDAVGKSPFTQSGTLSDWIEHVAQPCAGNSRPVFAIACAFAGVLLQPTGTQSGGFHFVGDSSIGKSTMLYVASSVFGSHKFMKTWNATSTALETTASQYSDTLLVLDEIGQVADPKSIGDVVYMLGNEQGKGRGFRAGGMRPSLEWRLMYLSSGEKRLSDIMKETGKAIKAGQETRLVNINADVNEGSVFERYDKANGGAMSDALKTATRQFYGTAGIKFIEYVQPQLDTLSDTLKRDIERLTKEWTPRGAHGQVQRVAYRFALVAVAGELATRAGVTGWKQGEAETAALMCFESWLDERGGAGNSEVNAMLEQVAGWFEANQHARFQWWHRAKDDHAPKVAKMAGYARFMRDGVPATITQQNEDGVWVSDDAGCEVAWYVYPVTFKDEICAGYDARTVARLLIERGIIQAGGDGRTTRLERLPLTTKPSRCYVFNQLPLSAFEA